MNATIIRLSAQALLGRRRFWLLLIIPVVMLVLALVVRGVAGSGVGFNEIVVTVGLGLVVPLVGLLATSSVLGPEIDDGSIVYLLAKPISRYAVTASKLLVALLATIAFGAVPVGLAGLIVDPSRASAAFAWFVAAVAASAAYCGLFLALAAVTRHAVVIGLLFVFLWEGLLGNLLSGVRWVSVGAWARQVAASLDAGIPLYDRDVGTPYAVIATLVLLAGSAWFAGSRLRSFSMRGET